jgi:carbon-monoxide dehydrogenase medium subunit
MLFYRPENKKKALEILAREGELLLPVAGCTDVAVGKHEKVAKTDSIIDLSLLGELKYIREEDDFIEIGALATHAEIAGSNIIRNYAKVLSDACQTVGSPQIRNRGTIGGNISHASPSGDSIPALMSLNAEFILESENGARQISAVEYFIGPGKTVRKKNELLVAIRFKKTGKGYKHCFFKLGQRKSLSCSKISLAFTASPEGDVIRDVRVSLGAVAPTVIRASKTEEFLSGKTPSHETIVKACEIVQAEVSPISDLRSTKEYRKQMASALLEKALKEMVQ